MDPVYILGALAVSEFIMFWLVAWQRDTAQGLALEAANVLREMTGNAKAVDLAARIDRASRRTHKTATTQPTEGTP
jgi:hypothetical protein